MKGIIQRQIQKIGHSDRGAAVLMVLLVSVFVIMMGSSVLFTSQNGYLIKLVDRAGLSHFYSTEDFLDQARAEVQDFSSDSLQNAYTKVMAEYAFIVSNNNGIEDNIVADAQNRFNEYFLGELDDIYIIPGGVRDGSSTTYTDTSGTVSSSDGVKAFHFLKTESGTDEFSAVGGTLPSNGFTTQTPGGTSYGGVYSASALLELLGYGNEDGVYITCADYVDVSKLDEYVADELASSYPLTGDSDDYGYFTLEHGVTGDRLVIKNVTISFMDDSGYLTHITTDIIIEMPDFVHTGETSLNGSSTTYESVPFENAASIGKYWVKFSNAALNGLAVEGDMYGGVFFIYSEGSDSSNNIIDSEKIKFTHGGGRLITHNSYIPIVELEGELNPNVYADLYDNFVTGTIKDGLIGFEIYDGAGFHTQDDSEIWALGINAWPGSDVELNGDTYVAGDLRVMGSDLNNVTNSTNYSNFVLAGSYFGFGGGGTAASDSSILIDGTGVNFSMKNEVSSLESLKIAGTSWLTVGSKEIVNNEYALAQSFSTLPDQIAYLIPAAALYSDEVSTVSNPIKFSTSDYGTLPSVGVRTEYVLWDGKTIGDYATGEAFVITNPSTTGDILLYSFYNFHDTDRANEYFRDYVEHSDTFQKNVNEFMDTGTVVTNFASSLKGNFYYDAGTSGIQVVDANVGSSSDNLATEAAAAQETFYDLSVTLQPTLKIADDYTDDKDYHNPYDYYVNQAMFEGDFNRKFQGSDYHQVQRGHVTFGFHEKLSDGVYGDLIGIYHNTGFTHAGIGNADPAHDSAHSICMIVANGGINLEGGTIPFEGLVMSSVGVAITSGINSNPDNVNAALDSVTLLNPTSDGTTRVVYSDAYTYGSYSGLDAYAEQYKDNLVSPATGETRSGAKFVVYEASDGVEYVVIEVPYRAYFDHLEYTTYDDVEVESHAGETDKGLTVNWGANDLVYFENWEKH